MQWNQVVSWYGHCSQVSAWGGGNMTGMSVSVTDELRIQHGGHQCEHILNLTAEATISLLNSNVLIKLRSRTCFHINIAPTIREHTLRN
jgi:hypothetical protein